jgi:peptide/nickel transport system substrate-binding protein
VSVKVLGLLGLALLLALSACTRNGGDTAPGGRHAWTKPGVLRIASLSEPDTLSPLVGNFQVDVDLSMFWAGYLFNYDDRDQLVPELATTVPTLANGGIARDGRTITYHLRRNVTWQDGAPFTSADVVFSWRAVMNPRNNVGSRTGYDDIVAIDAPNRETIVVHLRRPYAPFVNTFFTMSPLSYPVYPRHLLAQYPDLNRVPYNSAPIGTGPFRVLEWRRGEVLRMVANPRYWRGPPKLAEVEYHAIPDDNTILTSLQSHAIDLWYNAPSTLYESASRVPGTRPLLIPFTAYSQIGFNTSRPVLADARVRRALAYGLDRKRLIETVTYGVHVLGEADQPAFSWAHNAKLGPIPYNPTRAAALLSAAGWVPGRDGIRFKGGIPLRLELVTTSGNAVGNRTAVLVQSAWRQLGVDVRVRSYASPLMFASYGAGGILQTSKFDVDFFTWLNGTDPDDSTLLMCDQMPPNGQNSYRFCDRELDAQERIALSSFEPRVRKAAYDRIQEILQDRMPFITAWFQRRFDVVSDDLHGYRPARAVTTFWNTWEYAI